MAKTCLRCGKKLGWMENMKKAYVNSGTHLKPIGPILRPKMATNCAGFWKLMRRSGNSHTARKTQRRSIRITSGMSSTCWTALATKKSSLRCFWTMEPTSLSIPSGKPCFMSIRRLLCSCGVKMITFSLRMVHTHTSAI